MSTALSAIDQDTALYLEACQDADYIEERCPRCGARLKKSPFEVECSRKNCDYIRAVEDPEKRPMPTTEKREVIQYTKSWREIARYPSLTAAAKAVNRSAGNISHACTSGGTCADSLWEFA